MSVVQIDRAYQSSISCPVEMAVAVCLANYADDHGERCFPRAATIAAETRYSEDAVGNAIRRLEDAGHLTRKKRFGQSPLYTLHFILPKENKGTRHKFTKTGPRPEMAHNHKGSSAIHGGEPASFLAQSGVISGPEPERNRYLSAIEPSGIISRTDSVSPHHREKDSSSNSSSESSTTKKPKKDPTPSDPRHSQIMAEVKERYKSTTGRELALNAARDARSLQLFLKGWSGSLEDFWKVAETAWRLGMSDRFAYFCRRSHSLSKLCSEWGQIEAEIATANSPRPSGATSMQSKPPTYSPAWRDRPKPLSPL